MTEAELIQRAITGLQALFGFAVYFVLVHYLAWLYGRETEKAGK